METDKIGEYAPQFGDKVSIDTSVDNFSVDYINSVVVVPGTIAKEGRYYYIWTRGFSRARITNPEEIPEEKRLEEGERGVFYGELSTEPSTEPKDYESTDLNFKIELYGLTYPEYPEK